MKKTGNIWKIVLTMTILLAFLAIPAAAEDTTKVNFTVQYGQSEARDMLKLINDFRTGSDAWYWNEDDTAKHICKDLKPLEYDYELEQAAMQRAAELAIDFSHTRPNGTKCFSAITGDWYTLGENIAMGQTSAAWVFESWQENDDPYAGQGHRRNMLSENFTAIGIGHAVVDGRHFWVQEFRAPVSSMAKTPAQDGTAKVTVEATPSLAQQFLKYHKDPDVTTDTPKKTDTPKTTKATKLATPALKKAENVNGGVKLTWGKVKGAAKYRVFVKQGSKWVKIGDTTKTSFTWKKAKSGTKYTFTVRCVSKDGKSFTSGYNKTGKSIKYIAAPKLAKVQNTKSGVKVTWKKSAGAAKYRVFRKTANGWKKVGDTTKLTLVDKTAKKGVKYTYTVRCISKDGKSYTSSFNTKGLSIKRA